MVEVNSKSQHLTLSLIHISFEQLAAASASGILFSVPSVMVWVAVPVIEEKVSKPSCF